MKITVETSGDWEAIARIGGPVVDPMIVRCGELFLRGQRGVSQSDAAWGLMTKNIHALGTFFDRLILDTKIPVFNYADSFDLGQNFDQRTLARVNETEEILVDVDVRYAAYQEVKQGAMAELTKLYQEGSRGVNEEEARSILGELTVSGYEWYPMLEGLELHNDAERRLAAYILGGLIFGTYAQLAGADHLMQPKRSRLFLEIALQEKSSRGAEEILFGRLGELLGRPVADVPYTPTFFPLLLQQSDGPAAMLRNALEMRKSGEVIDYRMWLREALEDFNQNGRIPMERVREVETIANAIRRRMQGIPLPQVELKMTVADINPLNLANPLHPKAPGLGVDFTGPAKAGWGWMVEQLPGKRHRKLLSRAVIADAEYQMLDRRVKTVWDGPGGL